MIVELSALFVESVAAAAAILSEAKRRKSTRKTNSIVAALPALDFRAALAHATDARLAAMMRGAVTAAHLHLVISDFHVNRVMSEMVLASVVEEQDEAIGAVSELLVARTKTILEGKAADDDISFFANELAAMTREFCAGVLAAALAIAPNSVIDIQQLATMKRTHAILQRVSEQLQATLRTNSGDMVAQRRAFLSDHRAVCAEVHGSIKPPDFETNQRIPIEDLYVAPTIRPLRSDELSEGVDPATFARLVDRTVLLGDPGGGKSTLSNYLTMKWAQEPDGPVPFHVTLREFAPESDSFSVVQYIESQLPSTYQIQPPLGAIEDFLIAGNAVVIFDGLDELTDPSKRRAMTNAVETFAFRYPMVRLFVTSRRVGYEQAQLDPANFESFVIDGFDRDHVGEYVEKWFASQSAYNVTQASKRSSDFMSQSEAVKELSSNPLMLSLMCIIFRGENFIPRNRPAIYEKCANLLFETWDGHRQIEVPLKARDHVDAAMKHVAFVFLESDSSDTGIKRETLVREMTTYLHPRAMETEAKARSAAEEFVDFCAGRAWVFSDAGSTADGEPIFTFTHRTFMEYFAAVHLIRTTDTPERLAQTLLPRIAREEWDVVAQLAVQQSDKSKDQGTERALTVMLKDPRRRTAVNRAHVLSFIVRCCEFAVVSPTFLRELAVICFDFFAHFQAPNGDRFNDGLDPLLRLQDHVSLDQTELVIDATREHVLAVLLSPGDRRFEGAVFVVLLGLVRRFNGRMWSGHNDQRLDLWGEAFRQIAVSRMEVLEVVFEADPAGWANLALGGAITPKEGIERMKNAGLSFSDVYFANSRVHGTDVSGVPLAVSAAGASLRKGLNEFKDRDICEAIAALFLADFFDADRSRVVPNVVIGHGIHHSFPASALLDDLPLPEGLADFVVLVAMAVEEMTTARLEPTRRQKLFDLTVLDRFGLSSEIEKFAREWHEHKASIFDVTSPAAGTR